MTHRRTFVNLPAGDLDAATFFERGVPDERIPDRDRHVWAVGYVNGAEMPDEGKARVGA